MHERQGAPATPCRAESSFLSSLSQLFSRGFSEMRRRGGAGAPPGRCRCTHSVLGPAACWPVGAAGGCGEGGAARQPSVCAPPRASDRTRNRRAPARPDDVGGNHSYFVCFFIKSCTNPALWFLPPLAPLPGSGACERKQGRVPSEQRWRERCGIQGAARQVCTRARKRPPKAWRSGAGGPSPGSVSRLSDGQGLPGGLTPRRGQQGRGLRHSLRARLHPALALPCPSQLLGSRAPPFSLVVLRPWL